MLMGEFVQHLRKFDTRYCGHLSRISRKSRKRLNRPTPHARQQEEEGMQSKQCQAVSYEELAYSNVLQLHA